MASSLTLSRLQRGSKRIAVDEARTLVSVMGEEGKAARRRVERQRSGLLAFWPLLILQGLSVAQGKLLLIELNGKHTTKENSLDIW